MLIRSTSCDLTGKLLLTRCSFHTLLKGVKKPFDERITNAMRRTCVDTAKKFGSICAFTMSDEISLVFDAVEPHAADYVANQLEDSLDSSDKKQLETQSNVLVKLGKRNLMINNQFGTTEGNLPQKTLSKKERNKKQRKVHPYNGRVQKIASVTASYASARLNYHLCTPIDQWETGTSSEIELNSRMTGHNAYFDARLFTIPSHTEAMLCIYWRSAYDGFRNAISQIGTTKYGHSKMQGKSCYTTTETLQKDGIDVLEKYPFRNLFGTFVKKEEYEIKVQIPVFSKKVKFTKHIKQENVVSCEDVKHLDMAGKIVDSVLDVESSQELKRKTEEVTALRSRYRTGSFNWADWTSEHRTSFLMSKLWEDRDDFMPKDDELH